jgi:hypothetical protein
MHVFTKYVADYALSDRDVYHRCLLPSGPSMRFSTSFAVKTLVEAPGSLQGIDWSQATLHPLPVHGHGVLRVLHGDSPAACNTTGDLIVS